MTHWQWVPRQNAFGGELWGSCTGQTASPPPVTFCFWIQMMAVEHGLLQSTMTWIIYCNQHLQLWALGSHIISESQHYKRGDWQICLCKKIRYTNGRLNTSLIIHFCFCVNLYVKCADYTAHWGGFLLCFICWTCSTDAPGTGGSIHSTFCSP